MDRPMRISVEQVPERADGGERVLDTRPLVCNIGGTAVVRFINCSAQDWLGFSPRSVPNAAVQIPTHLAFSEPSPG